MRGALLAVALASSSAWAQPRFDSDAQLVGQASLVAASARIELYSRGVNVQPAFLRLADEAYGRLQALTGRPLDTATLGPKIRIYVADFPGPSHLWRGYNHPRDPKGIVFLNRRAYEGAMRGSNATYAHEMAHLFTWRYSSHTLREGIADYLALEIHPDAAVGPHGGAADAGTAIPAEIAAYLGTTLPPPAEVVSDERFRRLYYLASYRFVKFLVARAGMPAFLQLYDATEPAAEFPRLYGASREALVREALWKP